jgi:hypothetical protein
MELRVRDRNSTSGPVYNVSAQVAGHLYVEKP